MEPFTLKAPAGSRKKKKIVGRGSGTRLQKTAGKGNKGQNSRAGGGVRLGFEGGQMPLYRRIARRGFSNYPFKEETIPVNLDILNAKYTEGEVVNLASLKEKGIIKTKFARIKILGRGELEKKLIFEVASVSNSAKEKIQKSGGEIKEFGKPEESAPEETIKE
jgi:large subunit ribosomal protein L15